MHIMAKVTAFCGLYAMAATLPWSLGLFYLVSFIRPEAFSSSMMPGYTVIYLSGALNLYLVLSLPKFCNWIKNK